MTLRVEGRAECGEAAAEKARASYGRRWPGAASRADRAPHSSGPGSPWPDDKDYLVNRGFTAAPSLAQNPTAKFDDPRRTAQCRRPDD
jgi:hypothetical protein